MNIFSHKLDENKTVIILLVKFHELYYLITAKMESSISYASGYPISIQAFTAAYQNTCIYPTNKQTNSDQSWRQRTKKSWKMSTYDGCTFDRPFVNT